MSGSLRPSLAYQRLGSETSEHELSLFNSFPCPKSADLIASIHTHLVPHLAPGGKLDGHLSIIARQFPQNWQIAAVYLSESALAIGQLTQSPEAFWEAGVVLFKNQKRWGNERSQELSAIQIRTEASAVLADYFAKDGKFRVTKEQILEKTTNTPKIGPGASNAVTQDLLYNIKYARQISIQHTPSLTFDSIIQGHNFDGDLIGGISSWWGEEEWRVWVREKVGVEL